MHTTLDILYLLTGEDYVVLKMSGGRVTHSSSRVISGGFCSVNRDRKIDPMMEETKNDEKILELAHTITQLLTGEAPIRCQDVTVYFSMKEGDDLERSDAPTEDVMSEDQRVIASPDGPRKEEPCENAPKKNPEEDGTVRCDVMIQTGTPGTQTLIVKEEEAYEMLDQEEVAEDGSDRTGSSAVEKHDYPPSPEDSSKDDDNMLPDEQCDDFNELKVEIKSLEDGEEKVTWDDTQRKREDFPKKRKRGWASKKNQQKTEKAGREMPRRVMPRPLPSVIEVEEEEHMSLQRAAEWEIHADGSTHLMTCERPPASRSDHVLYHDSAAADMDAFCCSECDKCFCEASLLERHQREQHDPAVLSCAECGESCSTSSELGAHVKVHTGGKLFACSECGKCFAVQSDLLAHEAAHRGEKCGPVFSLKSSLDAHLAAHALEKPFSCSVCGKCFTSSARLAFHHMTHTGEKTYKCDECGKVFTASGSLNRHKRTHTGEKPYACSICGKCFNRETNLYRHQMIHTR
ncbi:hypothetical protein GDO81_019835 [Engystomops pustulosus]|uniref:C2H2-type domain-containing protein n=2 Tax=Engystomops pustulosus TaxID=76066 RepID=A0AAV6Z928_ENGPU|nr:hypothetical protein GDO81_019835 [Engystomops pustulosus]